MTIVKKLLDTNTVPQLTEDNDVNKMSFKYTTVFITFCANFTITISYYLKCQVILQSL